MGGARIAASLVALGCAVLAACDVPLGSPRRDSKGEPVVESTAEARVQVIVRMRFEAPDGAKPDDEAYQAALNGARERLFAELAALPHRVVRTYDALPLVVLSIAPADRAAVEKLPSVASVEEDRLNAPLAQ
jgi:hypothetical protein